jgi:putative Ca2+/H+ antiporter (TMEM165/GDT1 family)
VKEALGPLLDVENSVKNDFSIFSLFKSAMSTTNNLISGLVNSLIVIIVTELGDKTFFIAAVLAMRNGRLVVYLGAMAALALMHIMSSFMGYALPALLPRVYTHYASSILFVYFGIKLLKDAYDMNSDGPSEELHEVEEELGHKKEGHEGDDTSDMESGDGSKNKAYVARAEHIKVFTQAFTLTFLAEWGDRSQIATIALAASKNVLGVILGGLVGHAFCTGLAVIGGRLLAARISERTVAILGGVLFLAFAVHSFVVGP